MTTVQAFIVLVAAAVVIVGLAVLADRHRQRRERARERDRAEDVRLTEWFPNIRAQLAEDKAGGHG